MSAAELGGPPDGRVPAARVRRRRRAEGAAAAADRHRAARPARGDPGAGAQRHRRGVADPARGARPAPPGARARTLVTELASMRDERAGAAVLLSRAAHRSQGASTASTSAPSTALGIVRRSRRGRGAEGRAAAGRLVGAAADAAHRAVGRAGPAPDRHDRRRSTALRDGVDERLARRRASAARAELKRLD